jgi:hypothetical protein
MWVVVYDKLVEFEVRKVLSGITDFPFESMLLG